MNPSSTPADEDPATQPQDTYTQTLAELQAEIETEAEAEQEGEEQQESSASSSKSRPVSAVVPPWWQRHERNVSRASQSSLRNTITLEDHTADPDSETSRGLWARNVAISDHCVVQGKTGVGAYVVWNCVVQTLDVSAKQRSTALSPLISSDFPPIRVLRRILLFLWLTISRHVQGGPIVVRMRYSEFDDLRQRLVSSFPHAKSALPALPPKSVLCKLPPLACTANQSLWKNRWIDLLINTQLNSAPSSWRIDVLDWNIFSSMHAFLPLSSSLLARHGEAIVTTVVILMTSSLTKIPP
jgi:hypothetical protein